MIKILELFVKKKKNTILGIDLTTQDIKIVELTKLNDGRFKIEGYSCRQIPPGLVSEDIVLDTTQVGQIIKDMITTSKIQSKDTAISVPQSTVITKTISIIGDDDREIEAEIENSGKKHISLDIEEVDFDFKVMSNNESQNKEVLLVACKKKNITTREDTLIIAGLEPKIIDSEAYVYERIYPLIVDQIKHELSILDKDPNVILMVELFEKKLKVVLLNKGKVTYNEERNIEIESKRGKTLTGLVLMDEEKEEEEVSSYQKGVLATLTKILKLINSDTNNFISSICFNGNNGQINEVKNYIEESLQINCLIANPISNMEISNKINITDLMSKSSLLVIACGLAMRENIYD